MRMNESVVRRFPSFPLLPWNWICFVEINWTQTSVCVYLLHQVRTAVPHLAKEKRRFYGLESTFESIHPRGAGSKSRPTKQFRNQSDKITSHVFAYVSAHTTTFHDVCCWAGSSFPVRVGIGFSTFIFPSLCNSLSVESTLFLVTQFDRLRYLPRSSTGLCRPRDRSSPRQSHGRKITPKTQFFSVSSSFTHGNQCDSPKHNCSDFTQFFRR